jgi:sodium/hydrogen antiporter
LTGAVLLTMALSSAYLHRLPISTALIYLSLGIAIGPLGLGLLRVDFMHARWLEPLTEVAVIVLLFFGGLKLRLRLHDPAWCAVFRLAGPLMLGTMAAVALFAHLVLGLEPALALVLGAVLAPTDPVLAGAVSVNDSSDHDRVRFGLSGEAGLNDGMAFLRAERLPRARADRGLVRGRAGDLGVGFPRRVRRRRRSAPRRDRRRRAHAASRSRRGQ